MPRTRIHHETTPEPQRAFLVGVAFRDPAHQGNAHLPLEASLAELALLCQTAGLEVVGQTTQTLDAPHPKTFIGPGKVEELKAWQRALDFDVIVFDDELSPRHQRELEEAFNDELIILDRTALILDIFAQHARTREGALQVELAQYEYRKPRLTRQWTHLARQAGGAAGRSGTGGVGLRGPGETQLEIDRRRIDERIAKLRRELEEVRRQRAKPRRRRSGATASARTRPASRPRSITIRPAGSRLNMQMYVEPVVGKTAAASASRPSGRANQPPSDSSSAPKSAALSWPSSQRRSASRAGITCAPMVGMADYRYIKQPVNIIKR